MTGRTVTGRLSAVNPGYFHTFGDPIPELVHVGRDLRAGSRRTAPARAPRAKAVSADGHQFDAIMARRGEIMMRALGMDYASSSGAPSPSTTRR